MSKNSLPIFEDTGAVNVIESSFTPGIIQKYQEDFSTFALKALFCLSQTVLLITRLCWPLHNGDRRH